MSNVSADDSFRKHAEHMLAVALYYNAINPTRYIFPVKPLAKSPPLVQDMLDSNASNDPEKIRAWAKKWPGSNWGLALKKSGLMVVDVDTKAGKRGQATFDELDLDYTWPMTERVNTPSGGFHLYYDGPHRFALGTHGFGTDIDSPNYVLIAGCVFKDGTSYTSGNALTSVPAPPWFYEVLAKAKSATVENAAEAVIDLDKPENVEWVIEFLQQTADSAISGKNGDHTTFRVACEVKDHGISRDLAIDLMDQHYNPRCDPEWPIEELTQKVDNAYAYANRSKTGGQTAEADFTSDGDEVNPDEIAVQGNPATIAKQAAQREAAKHEPRPTKLVERPQVQILPGRLPEAMDQTQAILVEQAQRVKNKNGGSMIADQIFQRNGRLVRLNRNLHEKLKPVKGSKSRTVAADTKVVDQVVVDHQYQEHNALTIMEVRAPWLTTRLSRAIDYVGVAAGKPGKAPVLKSKDVAPQLVNQLLGETNTKFSKLFSTIEAPTLRADGSILDQPGYDPASGMFLDPGDVIFPKIKQNPTFAEGVASMKYLESELLDSFPFVDAPGYDGVSKSVAMAMILTAPVRRGLSIAPAFAVDSNEPESGKSMLLKTVGALATGREIAGRPFSGSEEERRKALGTTFAEARPVIFFDNVDGLIEGPSLEMALTTSMFEDRKLGSHELITAPTNSLILFSANHISVGGDGMTTRVLVCRIVPKKKLKQRLADGDFKHPDLIQWVIANRPQLIAHVLTALRAFIIHRKADAKPTISRFPEWGNLIGGALLAYGYTDPTRGGDTLRTANPVHEAMRDVMRLWHAEHGLANVTAAMLCSAPRIREAMAAAKQVRGPDLSSVAAAAYVKKMEGVDLNMPYAVEPIPQLEGRRYAAQWHLALTGIPEDAEPANHGEADDDDGGPDDGIEGEVAEVEAAGIAGDVFMHDAAKVPDEFADLM
jgi:hypothetical protein